MRTLIFVSVIALGFTACSVEELIRENDDRYAKPGALDSPITGIYSTYQFHLLDRYQVTHDWVNTAGCGYSALEKPVESQGRRSNFYLVNDIYEEGDITKQRGAHPKKDFNRFVRSVIIEPRYYKDISGQLKSFPSKEVGYQPICFESWWTSSHYLRVLLQRRRLNQLEQVFTENYPEGKWTSKIVNGRKWRVQEVSPEKLRARTGVGGPYQAWLLPLGESGYTMALEMGASRESLGYPQMHAAVEATFRHLVESVRVIEIPR